MRLYVRSYVHKPAVSTCLDMTGVEHGAHTSFLAQTTRKGQPCRSLTPPDSEAVVGVGNDGEGTPAGNFGIEGSHGRVSKCGKAAIIPLPTGNCRRLGGKSPTQTVATVNRKKVEKLKYFRPLLFRTTGG